MCLVQSELFSQLCPFSPLSPSPCHHASRNDAWDTGDVVKTVGRDRGMLRQELK